MDNQTKETSKENNEFPDPVKSFQAFSTSHSWYKHLVGDNEFAMIPFIGNVYRRYSISPDEDKRRWWFISYADHIYKCIRDPELLEIVKANTVRITPFVYSNNHGFCHTIGRAGMGIFDWMHANGYAMEAELIKKDTVDTSADGDSRYLAQYRGADAHNTDRAQGPVSDIFNKEQARMLNEVITAARNIWTALLQRGWQCRDANEPKSLNITDAVLRENEAINRVIHKAEREQKRYHEDIDYKTQMDKISPDTGAMMQNGTWIARAIEDAAGAEARKCRAREDRLREAKIRSEMSAEQKKALKEQISIEARATALARHAAAEAQRAAALKAEQEQHKKRADQVDEHRCQSVFNDSDEDSADETEQVSRSAQMILNAMRVISSDRNSRRATPADLYQ